MEQIKDRIKELEQKLAEAERRSEELRVKVAAGEEAALERVQSALGIEEIKIKAPTVYIKCNIPYRVNVNGRIYVGHCNVPQETFYVIQQALGDRRMRLLRELTATNNTLVELSSGGMAVRSSPLSGAAELT